MGQEAWPKFPLNRFADLERIMRNVILYARKWQYITLLIEMYSGKTDHQKLASFSFSNPRQHLQNRRINTSFCSEKILAYNFPVIKLFFFLDEFRLKNKYRIYRLICKYMYMCS